MTTSSSTDLCHFLILTIGIPGVGKTTWAHSYALQHRRTIVISSDAVRLDIFESDDCIPHLSPYVHEQVRRYAIKWMQRGYDVIIDSTNVSYEDWISYRFICPSTYLLIAKVFTLLPVVAIQQIATRKRKVPSDVIYNKWSEFTFSLHLIPYIFDFII